MAHHATHAVGTGLCWNDRVDAPTAMKNAVLRCARREDHCDIMINVLPGDRDELPRACPGPDRRFDNDRRQAPTRATDALRFSGSRIRVRRAIERAGPFFVDRFGPFILTLTVGVLVLCLIDGLLTIELLDWNSEEINPIMRLLLSRGYLPFLIGKYILTAAGLPFLVVYKNWPLFGTRFRAGFLLPIFFTLYLGLLTYQVVLLRN